MQQPDTSAPGFGRGEVRPRHEHEHEHEHEQSTAQHEHEHEWRSGASSYLARGVLTTGRPMDDWSPPPELDSYRLVRRIGRGGMGEVHLAHDTLLDRPVAIKFISSAQADIEARKRFLVEARAIARLQHPNVVSIHRVGIVDGHPYLVSEYVAGQPLNRVAKPIAWQQAFEMGMKLARALAAAHQRGVVHRDIKPANVMLTDEREPKLLDFGIAKLVGARGTRSWPGAPSLPPVSSRIDERDDPETVDSPVLVRVPMATSGPVVDVSDDETRDVEVRIAPQGGYSDRPLTQAGTVVGTPRYMAPEVLVGQPASYAADVYSFGALLFELCAGRPPRDDAEVGAIRQGESVAGIGSLTAVVPGIDPRFAEVIERCLRSDPVHRYACGNDVRTALAQLTPEARGDLVPRGNPYRGLRCFEADHRGLFFGRDSEIRGVLDRLVGDSLVLVVGDSGVGKSSLCRAGVLPRVSEWLDRGRTWSTVQLVPSARPLQALTAALTPLLGEAPAARLAGDLEDDPSALARTLRHHLGTKRGIVLLADQLEELVTVAEPAQAAAMAEALAWLSEPSPCVRVLGTLRADFLGRIAALPRFGEAAVRSLYFLRPLSEPRIQEAIVGPARAHAVQFESDALVDGLVAWTVSASGGLPLLQFALAELWDAHDPADGVIRAALLESFGGVAGALSRHGDQVLASMSSPVRASARRVLMRMVTPERTRARCAEQALIAADPDAAAAIAALVRGRLVVAGESQTGTTCELAHEALIRGWQTLAGWLAASEESRVARERLATAAADWERVGRRRDGLWNRTQLAEFDATDHGPLSDREHAFLRASRSASRRARLLRAAAAAMIPALVASTWAVVAVQARRETRARVEQLETHALHRVDQARAMRQRVQRMRQSAFSAFDAPNKQQGESLWSIAAAADGAILPVLNDAAGAAENAWLLDPTRIESRQLMATVLHERALAAESRRDETQVANALERMALYDDGGALREAWFAEAEVRFVTVPEGASVSIASVAEGSLSLSEARTLVRSPATTRLAPGSYVATIAAQDYATTQVPFVLIRGEKLPVDVAMIPSQDVPPDFVVVPRGRFSFGSSAEESLRRSYYRAAPVHEVWTDTYLIARHETTFADWIAYLEALPPGERRARAPRIGKGGFHGALELQPVAGGAWRLTIQPAEVPYTAQTGERLVYKGRARGASQNWLNQPVTGISASDAEGYASWLSLSGRVPQARLCTEREWERATRGADAREYAHRNVLTPVEANIDATYGNSAEGMGPDEVGSHPESRSPFGLDDTAGNAWEWTRSSLESGGYVARGGSYYYDANAARASNREVLEPTFRDTTVGVRICADARRAESARRAMSAR